MGLDALSNCMLGLQFVGFCRLTLCWSVDDASGEVCMFSCREDMFPEAISVAEQKPLLSPNELALLEGLAERVRVAAVEGAKEEEV